MNISLKASVKVDIIFIFIEDDPQSERGDSAGKFDYISFQDSTWLHTWPLQPCHHHANRRELCHKT